MVIEFARNVAGITDATSSEFDPEGKNPVIATMAEQVDKIASSNLGGTMRLGLYEANLLPGSIVSKTYGSLSASERHRHRYEVNNSYREQLASAGLVFSGTSEKDSLVEYVGASGRCTPVLRLHAGSPGIQVTTKQSQIRLFHGLVKAALVRQQQQRLFEES